MGQGKNWTPEDLNYLQDLWGHSSVGNIAKKLNRSKNAVLIKVRKLNLPAFLESGEYVTFNQLLNAIGYGGGYSYKITSWVRNRNFPLKYKTVNKCRFRVVYLEEFWKWAEKHRTFLDFSKFEENTLGKEPEWVKQQRKISAVKSTSYTTDPWTKVEDEKLKLLLKQYRYSYFELSRILRRSDGAIQRRICDLGLKERPIKADNHIPWTAAELKMLDTMITKGYLYESISDAIGKSVKAIRGKVYTLFGTECLDKVRKSMIEKGA